MADHLSPKQRIYLRRVKAAGARGIEASCGNATYAALESKGFIRSVALADRVIVVRWIATEKASP